jgi:hypothetical protein
MKERRRSHVEFIKTKEEKEKNSLLRKVRDMRGNNKPRRTQGTKGNTGWVVRRARESGTWLEPRPWRPCCRGPSETQVTKEGKKYKEVKSLVVTEIKGPFQGQNFLRK